VEDWAEIRRLHRAEGLPIKTIARTLGVSRNTVRAAVASDAPPKYERKPVGSAVDAFDDAIRQQLELVATMPATVIAERVGWTRGITVFKQRVAELRPAYLPPDPASRTSYVAGDIAQCDFWFPPIELPVGFGQTRHPTQLPVLTMVTGYSRWLSAVLVPTRAAEDLFAGWWRLIHALGAVPRTLVWDGETAVGRNRGGRIELTAACQAFRGVLGAKVIVLKPRKPEHSGVHAGIVERAHDYLERSFLPGRAFTGPEDFNAQLQDWLVKVNARVRRRLGCAPTDRIAADRQAMVALPPVAPATGWRAALRLPRDHYIRLDSNDYSVHPAVIGRRIEVVADLDRVRVFSQGHSEGRLVADHQRVWAWHQTLTDPDHLTAANALRRTHVGALRPVRDPGAELRSELRVELRVEQRSLTDYDTALGIDLDSTADTGADPNTDGEVAS
jgi:transposase